MHHENGSMQNEDLEHEQVGRGDTTVCIYYFCLANDILDVPVLLETEVDRK